MSNQFIPQYNAQKEGLLNLPQFKAYHRYQPDDDKPISFEYVISLISSVVKQENGIKATFEDGTAIFVGFDGSYIRYNRLGQKQSSRKAGTLTGMSFQNFHVNIYIYGKAISLERFVAICRDIINDALLVNYSDLTANVMDGSGSLETADYLQIPYNLEFDNIEWCSKSKNAAHGQKIKKLYEITGHVYRFSAEDNELDRLMNCGDNQAIADYCENNLPKVR
ncbi:MAG: hypothetical protein NC299_09270 [Lachnospiraceae bacterium]|nr:hypothetical protein [Ruminococcus sp.]MCM1275543.1 hypothetical protein [Lachnospiraceae bacterium]